jgi:aspartate carbamoyltransferase regulatory subunit
MNTTLSVSAIKNGTVIDHIAAGQAIKIIRLLKLADARQQMTIGLNLISNSMGYKDLIKIENKLFSKEEANQITLFAPQATINIIENFVVVKKINTELPTMISNILICPNKNCVTRYEPVASCFFIESYAKSILLICKYCEKQFERDRLLEEE